ncbi:MAG TPA: hypothetical protein VH475_05515 [Tepidisphaeraceae bacterium]|jgi:hypothetical protein
MGNKIKLDYHSPPVPDEPGTRKWDWRFWLFVVGPALILVAIIVAFSWSF